MDNKQIIIDELIKLGEASSTQLYQKLANKFSLATLKRNLTVLSLEQKISVLGNGKSSKYTVNPHFSLFASIDIENYYSLEIDARKIKTNFNWELLTKTFYEIELFSANEKTILENHHKLFQNNVKQLSKTEYNKELERLAIDLSWKSSQIEGNTYTLLETELLLKEKKSAKGKTKEEAIMLLNHKYAIDLLIEQKKYISPISVAKIENIHSLLIKDLKVDRNIRKRRVGISGTNYQPIDNEFQIKEALEIMCKLINTKKNIFEKALIALLFISYIQPFADGNKRTARILSNALLMDNIHCPLSFRTIDSIEYKKAMLLFYEQNNISAFKEIFIQQYCFATKTYF